MGVQAISTTDVIYPAWPLFLYTNAAIGKALLLPLLEYQATGQYPNKWAVHDLGAWFMCQPYPFECVESGIGTAYPNAPGYPNGTI